MAETIDTAKCPHCGGVRQGLVCSYCGSLLSPVEDMNAEERALNDFHGLLVTANPENQARLLRHGFLPDNPQVLIEAGLRTALLLRTESLFGDVSRSAAGRLKTIISKMRLTPETEESRRALKEFETALKDFAQAESANNRGAWIFCGVILLLTISAVWYLVSRLR